MCGRYVTISKVKTIEKRFNVVAPTPVSYKPNINISHGNVAPVITNDKPKELQFFQFGFTPSWAQKQTYIVNARSEGDLNKEDSPTFSGSMGIIQKPMFRKAIRSQRCLVPADAFIEGPKKERLNKPYLVHLRNEQRPFAFAGIWDNWVNTETGEIIHSFAIITTVANELLNKIKHHRSPVILSQEDEETWLDSTSDLAQVTSLLKPYPAYEMNAYPISNAIKNPQADGIELLAPVGERIIQEFDHIVFEDIKLEGMGMTQGRSRKNSQEQGRLF